MDQESGMITEDMIEEITKEFIEILDKYPSKKSWLKNYGVKKVLQLLKNNSFLNICWLKIKLNFAYIYEKMLIQFYLSLKNVIYELKNLQTILHDHI